MAAPSGPQLAGAVDQAVLDGARAEQARIDAQREAALQEAHRHEQARLEAQRQELARQEALRQQAAQLQAAQQEAARREAAKEEAARQEAAKQELAKQEAARQELAKQEAARQELAKQEAAKKEAAKQEAAKQELAKQEAARQELAKQEAARQERARQDAAANERAQHEALREERLQAIARQMREEARDNNSGRDPAPSPSGSLRRGWLFGRADANADLIAYAEAMSRKIELNMAFETVREIVKVPHVRPLVTVAVRADGSVEKVTFVVSSGVPAIDEAIRKVVESQAPYGRFAPALARQYDVIEIRRSWIFDVAIRLE